MHISAPYGHPQNSITMYFIGSGPVTVSIISVFTIALIHFYYVWAYSMTKSLGGAYGNPFLHLCML